MVFANASCKLRYTSLSDASHKNFKLTSPAYSLWSGYSALSQMPAGLRMRAMRTTRLWLSYLEETSAAAFGSSDSSSHSCAVSLRQQRRRRQLDFADGSGAAVRKPATRSSLTYLEETSAAAPSSTDSSSHS